MDNRTYTNRRFVNTLLEDEETVFKSSTPTKEISSLSDKLQYSLPKPSFSKRQVLSVYEHLFYGVFFLTCLISFIVQVVQARFGETLISLFGMILAFYGYRHVEPLQWKAPNKQLAFWNASVTMSVLLKSLHPKVYQWKEVWTWGFAISLLLSLFVPSAFTGVCFAFYLLVILLHLANRDFALYGQISFVLAWVSIGSTIFHLILYQTISLGVLLIGFTLYQVFERVGDLEIQNQKIDEEWEVH